MSPRKAGLLGARHPRRPDALRDLIAYASPLPAGPAEVDVPDVGTWGMCLNDQLGDCTIAAAAHLQMSWAHEHGSSLVVPSDEEVRAAYYAMTGGRDSGLVEADVLAVWRTQGLLSDLLMGYAPVNRGDLATMRDALAVFSGLYVGVQMPGVAQEQFEAGEPWHLTGTSADRQIEGGHAVPLLGYDAEGFACVTWGAVQHVTWDWWETYGTEAWALVPSDDCHDIDFEALEADLAKV